MMFTKALSLAAAFATLTSALPHVARSDSTPSSSVPVSASPSSSGSPQGGGVTIKNNLDTEVYMWVVGSTADKMQTLAPNGGTFSQSWLTPSNGGGVSIKLATQPEQSNILQFEYTLASPTIFWDLSCINMESNSEFTKYGFAVKPSKPGGSCPSAICHAGDTACAAAYLIPTDDHATHGCPDDTHLEMEIGQ